MRDNIDMWEPTEVTYQPTLIEVTTINEEITSALFSLEKVQQYPHIEFSLNYKPNKGQAWPQIVIKPENEDKKRLVRITTRSNLMPSKTVLEYFLDENGSITLSDTPTDSKNQLDFINRVEGLKGSLEAAKIKDILIPENIKT